MKYKLSLSSTIPVVAYGNIIPTIEVEGENYEKLEKDALSKLSSLWLRYSETPLKEKNQESDGYRKVETFTGETVLYNSQEHIYLSLDGTRLLGGSTYAKRFERPFNKSAILPKYAKKHEVSNELIEQMWEDNGEMSKGFGTAVHKVLENWFRYKKFSCYKTPKHPFLFKLLNDFPLKGEEAIPEVMVSDIKSHRVGQIDLFVITDKAKKQAYLVDYKTDAEIEGNLNKHFNQMSFYADILKVFGWEISKVEVWNYTDKWESYSSPVLPVVWK